MIAVVDPDLSTAGLDGLDVDARMRTCIIEATAAFRHGLWLSCVNLLGAVSEGAWHRAAERLLGRNAELDKAVTNDAGAATVIRLVAEELTRAAKRHRATIAELHSHAGYLRDLRNYGVHPKGADPAASQEHAFTEEGCALLLLSTHRYLERLAALVAEVVTEPYRGHPGATPR